MGIVPPVDPEVHSPYASWATGLNRVFARVAVFRIDGRFAETAAVVGSTCRLRVDLTASTALRWALEAASPVVGSGRAPGADSVSRLLGWSPPRVYVAVPLTVGDRIVAIAYADNESLPVSPVALAHLFANCARLLEGPTFAPSASLSPAASGLPELSAGAVAEEPPPRSVPLAVVQAMTGVDDAAGFPVAVEEEPDLASLPLSHPRVVHTPRPPPPPQPSLAKPDTAPHLLIKPDLPEPPEVDLTAALELIPDVVHEWPGVDPVTASVTLDRAIGSGAHSGVFVVTPHGVERLRPRLQGVAAASQKLGEELPRWRTAMAGTTAKIVLAMLLLLVSTVAPLLWAVSPTGVEVGSLTIAPSASVGQMASVLSAAGAIRSPRLFRWWTRIREIDGALRAGTYRLNGEQWLWRVAEELHRGQLEVATVTVPEGLTLEQTAQLLQKQAIVSAAEVIAAAHSKKLLTRFHIAAPSVEGFLFPETYTFAVGLGAEEVLAAMIEEFFVQVRDAGGATLSRQDLLQRVILASIVERETADPREAPRIAGVFHNRMARHMRLESCATVQYVLGKPKDRLLLQDLRVPSPYNTYLHAGLPPGPIANPGKHALVAALRPESHDYMFFVARGDGSRRHVFSRDFTAHQAAQKQAKAEQRRRASETTL